MNKTEYAWVIQRDDGKFYFECDDSYYNDFFGLYEYAPFDHNKNITFYKSKDKALEKIDWFCLQNCRPVKVEIRVVGEQYDLSIM